MTEEPLYIVELQGYNDGVPYEEARSYDLEHAKGLFKQFRAESPKVAHRLVQVIEDWSKHDG